MESARAHALLHKLAEFVGELDGDLGHRASVRALRGLVSGKFTPPTSRAAADTGGSNE
jgi:hypothetical protein